MGWIKTLLLGDIGNHLNMMDAESELKMRSQFRQKLQVETDQEQDKQIQQLRAENEYLRGCLAVVVRILNDKKMMSTSDLETFARILDSEDPDGN